MPHDLIHGASDACPGRLKSMRSFVQEWACTEELGVKLHLCGWVIGDFIRPCTLHNGVSLLCRMGKAAP